MNTGNTVTPEVLTAETMKGAALLPCSLVKDCPFYGEGGCVMLQAGQAGSKHNKPATEGIVWVQTCLGAL
jgi:hypothetical protein